MPKMPQAPLPNYAALEQPPAPVLGQQQPGQALRNKAQQNAAKQFGGSLIGNQLTAANTGGKSLLGQTG